MTLNDQPLLNKMPGAPGNGTVIEARLFGVIQWLMKSGKQPTFRLWVSNYGIWRSDLEPDRVGFPLNDAPIVGKRGCTTFKATAWGTGFRTAGPVEELASIAEMNGVPGQQLWNNIDAALTNYMTAQLQAFDDKATRLASNVQFFSPFNADIGMTKDGKVGIYEAHLSPNWKCVFL